MVWLACSLLFRFVERRSLLWLSLGSILSVWRWLGLPLLELGLGCFCLTDA